jgi:AcrR family transcriptional regulator
MRNRKFTEKRLIDAATRQFARHGLHGVSVRSIAKEADANLSLVSQYFGGKHLLYLKCVETIYADLQQALPELTTRLENDPTEAIRYAISAAIEFGAKNRDALLLTMRHFIEHGQMDSNRRDTVLIPTVKHLSIQLAPHSNLGGDGLELAVLGAIMLIGRLVGLAPADLTTIIPFTADQNIFINTTNNMVCRMIGLDMSSPSNTSGSRRLTA